MDPQHIITRKIQIAGALGLSFTAGGCAEDPILETDTSETSADDGADDCERYCCSGTCWNYGTTIPYDYTSVTPWPTFPTTTSYYCDEDGCTPTTEYDPSDPSETLFTTIPDTDTIFTDPLSTGTGTDTDTSTGSTSDTDTSTGSGTDTDTTSTSTGDTSTSTGDTSSSTGDTDTDTSTGGDEEFPPLGVFGDDIIELDLVGSWSLQWSPDATTFDSVLTIDSNGEWIWRETSADCTSDTLGTGVLWVESGQLVLHIDTWERQLPWDTLAVMGQEFPPPFRMRMSYALLGLNLMLAAPDRITEAEPYVGRAYLQAVSEGAFIAGEWVGEAELLAAVFGDPVARVIVRDSFVADLAVEPGLEPESVGVVSHAQTYYGVDPPVASPTLFDGGSWTCLEGCPQPAGATLINGGNVYAYGPYAGFQRLASFTSGRTFRRDIDTDCP